VVRIKNRRHRYKPCVVRALPSTRETRQVLVTIKHPWKERMHFKEYKENFAPYTNNTAYKCSQWDWYYKMRKEAI